MIMHTTGRHRACAATNRLLLLLIAVFAVSAALATEPRLVPFQARLTDGAGADLTGLYSITFAIYDEPTGGTALWSEVHPSASVVGGRVSVLLGNDSAFDDPDGNGDSSDAVQFDQTRYVGIRIGAETNQEMVPRHQLVPAFHARSADGLTVTNADATASIYGANAIVPIGAIIPFYGNPGGLSDNWKLCDGSIVSDPKSPLNGQPVPNMLGRVARGAIPGQAVGAVGGQDSQAVSISDHSHGYQVDFQHTHAVSHEPSHKHETDIVGNSHNMVGVHPNAPFGWGSVNSEGGSVSLIGEPDGNWGLARHLTSDAGHHEHALTPVGQNLAVGSTAAASLAGSVDIVPSYVALHWIIRIK